MEMDEKLTNIDTHQRESMRIDDKLMKIGGKGSPGGAASSFELRTAHRDDASYARFLVILSKL